MSQETREPPLSEPVLLGGAPTDDDRNVNSEELLSLQKSGKSQAAG